MTKQVQRAAGLEGIVAADTDIAYINGSEGELIYAGYDIREIADKISFEEACFLLWKLRLPNKSELSTLSEQFDHYAKLPKGLVTILRQIPVDAAPMDVIRSGVSLLSHFDDNPHDNSLEALQEKAIRLTAQLPILVATFERLRKGKEPVPHQAGLGLAERFLYHLKGERPVAEATKAMDVALVLHAEHGFNASTFSARVTIATLSDIYSAITSAIGTLRGPLHGGANERVIAMLQEIGTMDNIESWIKDQLDDHQRIFGFGHRVYTTIDPRAVFLKRMAEELGKAYGQDLWYKMSLKIEDIVVKEKGINPNVDFYSASVYQTIGIPVDLFTPIFAISRISGWTAHVMEQMKNNRLIRPRAQYVGPRDLKFVPIENR